MKPPPNLTPSSIKPEYSPVQSTPTIYPSIKSTFSVIEEPAKVKNPYRQYFDTPFTMSQEMLHTSPFSSTQDAIASVRHDITSLRQSFPSPTTSLQSSSHQLAVNMGAKVRELKKEVMFLVKSLQNSMRHKEILQRRLSYFEEREENELIKQSREYERDKEIFQGATHVNAIFQKFLILNK